MLQKFLFSSFFLLNSLYVFSQDQVQLTYSRGEGKLIRVTPALDKARNLIQDIPVRDEKGMIRPAGVRPVTPAPPAFADVPDFADPVVQKNRGTITPSAAIGSNFNGQGYNYVNPPDPSLAVGPNHVIQMINGSSGAYFVIYSKTGSVLKSQTYLDQITGRGGLGDPIVLYDQLADRFVMTEFANRSENSSEGLVVAVSQTSNPTGSWYVYFFSTGTSFPDYPKFSVWNDGYYATSNDYVNNSYNGSTIYAFDRSRMLTGQSVTTYQQVKFSTTNFTKYLTMCPVLLQGNTVPPAGTGGLFAYMFDGSWTSTNNDADSVGLIEYRVNWSNPSASTLVNRSSLRASDFKSQICTASRGACIPQPGTTTRLEGLEQKVMNQPIYRNFGNREGVVMTHIIDKGSSISAIRWYELQKTTGNWSINQQSTYSPDNVHRWMPSIAYDAAGNIALAYNVSDGSSVFPGIRYTGRRSCDPLNTMTYAETAIANGTSRNGSSRYGDYSHLVADPNGQSFWFTGEWNSSLNWRTQITNFNLDNCGSTTCNSPIGLSASNITSTGATLSWTAISGAVSYDVDYKTTSSATWINAATGTTTTSVNLAALTASTVYDWRVRTNCSGGSSGYSQAQFSTIALPVCNAPSGLITSNVTSTAATLSWTAVSGAINYDVDYKTNASTVWINAATASTSRSINLSALTASTVYDWRVRTNCSSGTSSYTQSQFTTPGTGCSDPYEVNNTRSAAAAIPVNTNLFGLISTSTDADWFRFNNTTATPNIRVSLTNLAADYDVELYRQGTTSRLAISQNAGTTSETINYSTSTVAQHEVRVFGYAGAFNATNCYTLRIDLSGSIAARGALEPVSQQVKIGGLQVYPNPAKEKINIAFDANQKGKAEVRIIDLQGRVLNSRYLNVGEGVNVTSMDVSGFVPGVYMIRITVDNKLLTKNLVLQ